MKIRLAMMDFHGMSMRIAQEDLGLTRVAVVHPGVKRYPLSGAVEAVPLSELYRPGSLFSAPVLEQQDWSSDPELHP